MYRDFPAALLVLNIEPARRAMDMSFVDWLREQESLPRIPLVVYSGRDLTPTGKAEVDCGC